MENSSTEHCDPTNNLPDLGDVLRLHEVAEIFDRFSFGRKRELRLVCKAYRDAIDATMTAVRIDGFSHHHPQKKPDLSPEELENLAVDNALFLARTIEKRYNIQRLVIETSLDTRNCPRAWAAFFEAGATAEGWACHVKSIDLDILSYIDAHPFLQSFKQVNFQSLEELKLTGKFDDDAAELLASATCNCLSGLTKLELVDIKSLTDTGLAAVLNNAPNLQVLDIFLLKFSLNASSGRALSKLSQLKSVTFVGNSNWSSVPNISVEAMEHWFAPPAVFPHLSELRIEHCRLGADHMVHLAGADLQHTSLHLCLTEHDVRDNDVEALVRASWIRNLVKLELQETNITCEGALLLAKAGLDRVTSLSLSNNRISDRGVHAVSQSFRHCLKQLNLSNNNFTSTGIEHLANSQWENIEQLHLHLCDSCMPESLDIFFCCRRFHKLKELHLSTRLPPSNREDFLFKVNRRGWESMPSLSYFTWCISIHDYRDNFTEFVHNLKAIVQGRQNGRRM